MGVDLPGGQGGSDGGDGGGESLKAQIDQLARQPGLEYLNDLAHQDGIDWKQIELARREWDHEQQGLTAVGAALLSIAVAMATGSLGVDMLGTTSPAVAGVSTTSLGGITLSTTVGTTVTTTAAGAALNAGMASLASMSAVSFVNNGGDVGAVLKDLGSKEAVQQLLVGMAGAGMAQGLSNTLSFNGTALSDITKDHGAAAYLGRQLVEHGARASANALLLGTPLDEALEGALVSSLLSTGTAFGANAIGDLGVPDGQGGVVLNAAGRQVLHALLGCAAGSVQAGSDGCAAGAAGAVLGELAAGWYNPDGSKGQADTVAFANLVAGLGGALVARDGSDAASVAIAATAGSNAAANNYLSHLRPSLLRLSEVEQYERASAECAAGDAPACGRRDALIDLSRQRDRHLQAACSGSTPALCNGAMAEARGMGNVVHGQTGQVVYANSPKAAFALNVATVGPIEPNPALRENFHAELARSTASGLLMVLPGPEDVVAGALLLTAPGKALAEVVMQGGQKVWRFVGEGDGGVNPALLNELATKGVKFTPENVIATARAPSGQVVFLETGDSASGLMHIVQRHATDFANVGISEAQIPGVVTRAVSEGNIVGYQGRGTGRPIYEVTVNGQAQRIAITTGSNGYIVGANPAGSAP